jgi:pyruvate ferredoxin oxidoreductase beta subunit/2-oxoisovalerate ferredoxin oxidoreductase beta subunit
MSLGLQWLDEVLGEQRPIMVVPACCASATTGAFPTTAYGVPTAITTFASAAAVGTGVSRVRRLNGETTPTVCWAGDGGTYDIGMATLSAAAERNEDVLYVCYDNEIYGNTGGQRSSATRPGAKTSTTQEGKLEPKKDIMSIMAAHRVPYAATLSLGHREDYLRKLKTARQMSGFRFLLLLSPCPAGWKSEPAEGIDLVRKAVTSGLFPLYEVFGGRRYRINARPDGTGLEDYVSRQGRFKSKALDIEALRSEIAEQWAYLETMARDFPAPDEHEDESPSEGREPVGSHGSVILHRVLSVAMRDEPGELARVLGEFARLEVNVADVVVRPSGAPTTTSVVMITFDAHDALLPRLIEAISAVPGVESATTLFASSMTHGERSAPAFPITPAMSVQSQIREVEPHV